MRTPLLEITGDDELREEMEAEREYEREHQARIDAKREARAREAVKERLGLTDEDLEGLDRYILYLAWSDWGYA